MKKLVIFSVLVMSTRAALGLLSMNPDCRFNQSDPCYGAVGRPLYLQLPSEDQLDLKKNISGTDSVYVFRFKNQKITQDHSDYPRWQFVTNNSTMIINSAEKRDSGKYILETFNSNGTSKGIYQLQLVIEDMLLIVLGSTAVVLILLSIISYFIYRKKQAPKNIGSSQNDGELLYVQVTHKPTGGADNSGGKAQAQGDDVEYATVITQPKRKKKKQAEDEVQYGEVAFNTGGAKHRKDQPKEQDECVYSQVHHNR